MPGYRPGRKRTPGPRAAVKLPGGASPGPLADGRPWSAPRPAQYDEKSDPVESKPPLTPMAMTIT